MTVRLRQFLYLDDTLVSAYSRQLDATADEPQALSPDSHDLGALAFNRLYGRIAAAGLLPMLDDAPDILPPNSVIEVAVHIDHSPLARAIGVAEHFAEIQTMLDLFTKTKTIRKHDAYFASISHLQQHDGVPVRLNPLHRAGFALGGSLQGTALRVPLDGIAGDCTALLTVQRSLAAGELVELFDPNQRSERKMKMKSIPDSFRIPVRYPGALVNVVALYR